MVSTLSTMLPLGTEIPEFALANVVDGRSVSPGNYQGKVALVVMFVCNHCPYVRHVLSEITGIGRAYGPKGIGFLAINSNDPAQFPDDAPARMKELAQAEGWSFPFTFDESQDVAKAFRAACTPDFFVFDEEQKLVYRGQLDDSRPGNDIPVTGRDLRAALDALIAGKDVPNQQKPSIGCNIKWKKGNAPAYYAG
jgi:thiol-disulfide isomerase/thioredoxin